MTPRSAPRRSPLAVYPLAWICSGLLFPAAATAQGLWLEPSVGVPLWAPGGADEMAERQGLHPDGAPAPGTSAYGLALELDLPLLPLDLRAGGQWIRERSAGGGKRTALVGTGDVVFRLLPRLLFQPYLLVGGGVARETFQGADASTVRRPTRVLHVGAGVDLQIGGLGLLLEADDYVGTSARGDAPRLHDAFVKVGLRLRVF